MKEIKLFKSKDDALSSLDNGGRFYDFFAKANDGKIEKSELAKVAGTFGQKQRMILYLDMTLQNLSHEERNDVTSSFSTELEKKYSKYKADRLEVQKLSEHSELNKNIIVTAFPKAIRVRSDFKGFVQVPIVSNNITSSVVIPMTDQYQVYELFGENTDSEFIAAHSGKDVILPGHKILIGGVVKEMKLGKSEESPSQKYLEAHYFSELVN